MQLQTSMVRNKVSASSSSSSSSLVLARETLRLSANLATHTHKGTHKDTNAAAVQVKPALVGGQVICREKSDGKSFNYFIDCRGVLRPTGTNTSFNPSQDIIAFIKSCVVPEGYPDSVTSSYMPYMQWRALKYFFGGAMGVFTTRSLLHSVGVSGNGAVSSAIAVNWVLKDGAGRIGKMLFARQGKKFDSDLKQLRFAGDLLMEIGAGVELATMAAPHYFLPFACIANIAKNVAAVTSTSTRSHIYKAFAKGENIGDVTAKGECISNVADLMGTGLSIFLSKRNPSLLATFSVLSVGYIFCSYQEVKSVVLNSLNRRRFAIAVESFLTTGQVPSLQEGNWKETIFPLPCSKKKDIALGGRLCEAFEDPRSFLSVQKMFEKEKYIVTFSPSKGRAYALLKEKANSDEVLRASFHAHLLSHIINTSNKLDSSKSSKFEETSSCMLSSSVIEAGITESCSLISHLYEAFKNHSKDKGWMMAESLLNPGNARICE